MIFKRWGGYKDSGVVVGEGFPTLRGGLHSSLPPNAYLNINVNTLIGINSHVSNNINIGITNRMSNIIDVAIHVEALCRTSFRVSVSVSITDQVPC